MIIQSSFLGSPITFALLISVASFCIWQAVASGRGNRTVDARLTTFLTGDIIEETELSQPFRKRVVAPLLHKALRMLGAFMPKRNLDKTAQLLAYAGNPVGITGLDFLGLRLLTTLALALGYGLFMTSDLSITTLRNAFLLGVFGYFLPWFWLRSRVRRRQNEIRRALPDALDMLTIGVEAGLAFESALLRVGQQWQNPLTDEFNRVVGEMHMGSGRVRALERMVERTGVAELATFVAVLVQSTQLGVSIAQVLHSQAEQMRTIRRQRAEEQARQASVKIVVVLVFFIFPSMFIVILGPAVPRIMDLLNSMAGG